MRKDLYQKYNIISSPSLESPTWIANDIKKALNEPKLRILHVQKLQISYQPPNI